MIHTSRSAPGPQGFTCRAMSAETMKIPEPIMDPTTSEMAASGLMPRMNSEEVPGSDAGGASVGAAMGVLVWDELPCAWDDNQPDYSDAGGASPGGTAGGAADWAGFAAGSAGLPADSAAFTA